MLRVQKNVKVFETVEDFVEHFTSQKASPNVKLANVQNLFFYLIGFLMLVSLSALANAVLTKQLQSVNRRLATLFDRLCSMHFRVFG